ncbi:MAG: OmpA family protein [Betaproteobacteria bacterium]|nr:OmpA family protein [Betaproteobacteria bacterium]
MRMITTRFLVLACLALPVLLPAASKDKPGCKPNPVFEPFPNTSVIDCEQSRFNAVKMLRTRDGAKPGAAPEAFQKEGQYWYIKALVDRDGSGSYLASQLEIRRNDENAVRQAKGAVLNSDARDVYYQINRPDGEYWGHVECSGGSGDKSCGAIVHTIVRVAAMEQSVVVSADQIAKDMGDSGKVVFYGIYFDTDKATIKTESAPTLAEMAKLLKNSGNQKVFIVGHTDMQGVLDGNQKLSRDRAAAVSAALVKDHGIKGERLSVDGVGPLAPIASNAT